MSSTFFRGAAPSFGDEFDATMWDHLPPSGALDDEDSLFRGIGSILWDDLPPTRRKVVAGLGRRGYMAPRTCTTAPGTCSGCAAPARLRAATPARRPRPSEVPASTSRRPCMACAAAGRSTGATPRTSSGSRVTRPGPPGHNRAAARTPRARRGAVRRPWTASSGAE
jgi:hypothetical protein